EVVDVLDVVEKKGLEWEEEEKKEEQKKQMTLKTLFGRLLRLSRPEAPFIALGILTAALIGSAPSFEAILLGNVLHGTDLSSLGYQSQQSAKYFIIVATAAFLAHTINGGSFGVVSSKVLSRVRSLSFATVLNRPISWHDKPSHSSTLLITSLNNDTANFGSLTGVMLGTICAVFVNLFVSIVLALSTAWRIALVILVTLPLMLLAGYYRHKIISDFATRHETAYAQSASVALDSLAQIRTIASFTLEGRLLKRYEGALRVPYESSRKAILKGCLLLSLALSASYLLYALGYYYGSRQVSEGHYSTKEFYLVLTALLFGAQASGQLFTLAPNIAKGRIAAGNIFGLVDGDGNEDLDVVVVKEKDGEVEMSEKREGGVGVEIKGVGFAYPERLDKVVLDGLDMSIKPGEFAMIVGENGSGKSTVFGLLERFYNPTAGTITIDNQPHSTIPLSTLRQTISLVSQDATLFTGTIRENILLGISNPDSITQHQLESACKLANCHTFITALPESYDTPIGGKNVGLSGGQRQRICIARAIIRQSRLLLLDEATSALDSQSEELVNQSLEELRRSGRMTMVGITHRLESCRGADRIFVMEQGKVVETGGWEELCERKGKFWRLLSVARRNGGDGSV
ncbi:hypothetical protein HK097_003997, partial [Rhizophlyctis rosea]